MKGRLWQVNNSAIFSVLNAHLTFRSERQVSRFRLQMARPNDYFIMGLLSTSASYPIIGNQYKGKCLCVCFLGMCMLIMLTDQSGPDTPQPMGAGRN